MMYSFLMWVLFLIYGLIWASVVCFAGRRFFNDIKPFVSRIYPYDSIGGKFACFRVEIQCEPLKLVMVHVFKCSNNLIFSNLAINFFHDINQKARIDVCLKTVNRWC